MADYVVLIITCIPSVEINHVAYSHFACCVKEKAKTNEGTNTAYKHNLKIICCQNCTM